MEIRDRMEEELMARIWQEHQKYIEAIEKGMDQGEIDEINMRKEKWINDLKELIERRMSQ